MPPIYFPFPRYEIGDVTIIDTNFDGVFSRGDLVSASPDSDSTKPMKDRIGELKNKYHIDLQSGRSFRLNPAVQYFGSIKVAENLAENGDLDGVKIRIEQGASEAKHAGIKLSPQVLKSMRKDTYVRGVEAQMHRAEMAALSGDRPAMETALANIQDTSQILDREYRFKFPLPAGWRSGIDVQYVKKILKDCVNIRKIKGLEASFSEARNFAAERELPDIEPLIAVARAETVNRILDFGLVRAFIDTIEESQANIDALHDYLQNTNLDTPDRLEKLETMQNNAYLNVIMRAYDQEDGNLQFRLYPKCEISEYTRRLGLTPGKEFDEFYDREYRVKTEWVRVQGNP